MMVARASGAALGGSSPSYSLFASGVEPVSFEPGIAVDHANQFCQWVADVILQHGGMMTSANLGSTLVAEDPERYATIKAVFGGLCGLLTRYPQRFALVNNQPLNHVAVIGAAPMPAPLSPPGPPRLRVTRAGRSGSGESFPRSESFRSQSSEHGSPRGSLSEVSYGLASPNAARRAPSTAGSDSSGSVRGRSNARSRPRSNSASSPGCGSRRRALADRDELEVVRQTREILEVASEHALKAVDLANALRNRVGVDVLGRVREAHGGLLSLLERHRDVVRVRRVPKHDVVSLATPPLDYARPRLLRPDAPFFPPPPPPGLDEAIVRRIDGPTPNSPRRLKGGPPPAAGPIQRRHTYDDVRALQQFLPPPPPAIPALERGVASVRLEEPARRDAFRKAAAEPRPRSSFGDDIFHQPPTGDSRPPPALASIWTNNDADAPPPNRVIPRSRSYSGGGTTTSPLPGAATTDGCCVGGGAVSPDRPASYACLSSLSPLEDAAPDGGESPHAIWEPPEDQLLGAARSARCVPSRPRVAWSSSAPSMMVRDDHAQQSPASPPQRDPAAAGGGYSSCCGGFATDPPSGGAPPLLSGAADQGRHADTVARSRRSLDRLMCEDYVPTQRWPRDETDDATLVATVGESLDHLRGCATLNKLRSALKQRYNLPRSVKSVPLRAFLAAYADLFALDGAHVYLRDPNSDDGLPPNR
ncbi:hypothetical protein CTAYLR_001274 [Chrysophaeum taylorii]|uniref:Uncharacterized protein n=1 Tax=Chrysophaeum taylorii TaxID=2483200 RepID=A0AAD7XLA1_9STRA|nr:hypothetical protein CTAYLR_001274 [Chrysophaeum taylorii]